jgi:hypothetical protein
MQNENINEDDRITLLKKKAHAFLVLDKLVHISFNDGKFFKRGFIKEVKADFFMLEERLEGLQPIFFQEVKSIELYKVRREDLYGKNI